MAETAVIQLGGSIFSFNFFLFFPPFFFHLELCIAHYGHVQVG